jgi:YtcA-like protein
MKAEFGKVAPSSRNNPPRVRRLWSRSVRVAALLLLIGAVIFVVRPLSDRSPTIDILGSYFPAWMVCIISGLTLTLAAHWIVQVCHLKPYLGPPPLIYSSLMIIFTFAIWILFYQN